MSFAQVSQSTDFSYGKISEPSSLSVSNNEDFPAFKFPITSKIYYRELSHFQTKEGKGYFAKALQLDLKAAAIEQELTQLRKEYLASNNVSEKSSIGEEILQQEKNNYSASVESKKLKQQANKLEYAYWSNASSEEIEQFTKRNIPVEISYTQANNFDENALPNKASSITLYNKRSESKTAPKQEDLKNQTIYKIQVGRFTRTPKSIEEKFKKLGFIRRIEQQSTPEGKTLYTVGELNNYSDAKLMQAQLEKEGFEKTLVIAFKDGIEIEIDDNGNPINNDPTETITNTILR